MKALRIIHTYYGLVVFGVLFIFFFPLLLIPILLPQQYHLVGTFNRWWARILFIFLFLPYKVEFRSRLDHKKQYIFCPNHFSYLDIPTLGLNPHNCIFVGKIGMERIPLFGFMYRKLHITVDRSRLMSKYSTFVKSQQAIEEGKSLVIFPEGGILSTNIPGMAPFKDGAFRLAIEKQIPIIPVTIPSNWIILPCEPLALKRGKVKIIFHEPVRVAGLTGADLDQLKNQVNKIINKELQKYENR